ncbi:MAG: hypothetical protein AAGA29_05810 [Planctomycetota bacterium]
MPRKPTPPALELPPLHTADDKPITEGKTYYTISPGYQGKNDSIRRTKAIGIDIGDQQRRVVFRDQDGTEWSYHARQRDHHREVNVYSTVTAAKNKLIEGIDEKKAALMQSVRKLDERITAIKRAKP